MQMHIIITCRFKINVYIDPMKYLQCRSQHGVLNVCYPTSKDETTGMLCISYSLLHDCCSSSGSTESQI